jgi:hypothetical protein
MSTIPTNNYSIAQRKRATVRSQLVPCAECGCRFIDRIGEQLTGRCTNCGRIYQVRDGVQTTLGYTTPSPVRVSFDPSVVRGG